jgi:hypothetical protein
VLAALAVFAAALVVGARGALAASPPAYNHVVLAIFENKARSQIIGAGAAPYLNRLAAQGANFTQSFALRHPSQPNYLDLFSGSNHGLEGANGNACPQTFASGNLGHQLITGGRTFVGYAEDLPSAGSPVCSNPPDDHNGYWRKHAPWTNFTNLDQTRVSQPYRAFPTDFTKLPTVSFVVPNQCNDMHNDNVPGCSISHGDTWAKNHLDAYAQWAKTHNSLLIVTWDEDNSCTGCTNQIATFFVGAHINPGNYSERIDHFTVLRTIEAMYGLPAIGSAAHRSPITNVFAPALALTSASQTQPRRWRLGGKLATFAAARKPRVGTTFRFTLNGTATVRFAFDQLLPGRKLRNGRCVAQTARNRGNKACTRSVPRGALSFNAGAGVHRLFFQGRVTRTRKLHPGTYTLTITAANAAGERATRTLRSFTIVPG